MSRSDGRANDELRPVTFVVDFVRSATGSVLIEQGETRVICTASVVDSPWEAARTTREAPSA